MQPCMVLRRATHMPWDNHPLSFILPYAHSVSGTFDDHVRQVHLVAGNCCAQVKKNLFISQMG